MSPAELLVLDEIDSTNAEARRLAEAGHTGSIWIAARRQNAGRGRRGRAWSDHQGNLAATYLCVTHAPPAEAAQTSFLAALAVADLLDRYVPPACVTIKWPNDVMIEGMKASGILVESGPAPAGGLWLAVGIGPLRGWVGRGSKEALPTHPHTHTRQQQPAARSLARVCY